MIDSLSLLRDYAWDKFDNYIVASNSNLYNIDSIDEVVDMFKNLAVNYSDFYSYYSLGVIYENYLYNSYLSIKYYLESYKICNDTQFRNSIKNKMLLVENDLNTSSIFLNQKLNYIKATQFITNEFNIDSAMLYLQFNYQDELLDNKVQIDSKILHDLLLDNKDNLILFKVASAFLRLSIIFLLFSDLIFIN